MKLKLILSWLVFAVAAIFGAQLGVPNLASEDRLFSALRAGYFVWALYWGVPLVLGWWWRNRYRGPFILQLILPFLALSFGAVFSIYGGGIYQFLKTWWLHSKAGSQQ